MENREIEVEVLKCINSYLPENKTVDLNEALINIGVSSVEIMEIICQVEDKFSVVFTDSDLRSIKNGNDIVVCFRKLKGISDNF